MNREQNWHVHRASPGGHRGRRAAQLELLQPTRERPWVLDNATVARIIRVHRDQADDLALFGLALLQNQADRWKAASLTTAQQTEVADYEPALAQLEALTTGCSRSPSQRNDERRTLARSSGQEECIPVSRPSVCDGQVRRLAAGYGLGSDRGSPNHGRTLFSKRVMAQIRSPVKVST